MLNIGFPTRPRVAVPTQLAIEAVVIDQAALNAEIEKRDRAAREAEQRRVREQRQAREAAERQQRERDETARREQERVVELRRQQERAEQEKRAKAEAEARAKAETEKRERERLAAEQREREQRQREEAARREREAAARAQAQREADLMAAAKAEEERLAAERAGLLDQYIRLLQNHVEKNWIPPASARAGINCVVHVVQIPSGDVIDARVGQCNADDAVIRSIEAAVQRASPLPKPPHPSLFERNLNLVFQPNL
jgi:colicin import membrane protein